MLFYFTFIKNIYSLSTHRYKFFYFLGRKVGKAFAWRKRVQRWGQNISGSENPVMEVLSTVKKLHPSWQQKTTSIFDYWLSVIRIINQHDALSLNLLRIKGLYMFQVLLAHPQEELNKRYLVYCMCVMSVDCTNTHNIPTGVCAANP
jgi:hypothetical protein